MTQDQFVLLQDKVALWRKASTEGSMELRDYNRRAGEALTAAIVERAELLATLKLLTDNIEQAWPSLMHLGPLVAARAAIAKAEGQP